MNETKLQRRAFLSSIVAIVGVKVSEVPMPSGVPSHWIHIAFRFVPSFGFFARK